MKRIQEDTNMRQKLNTNQLREIAVELGADRSKLYGTSRTAMLFIINKLKKEKEQEERT